MSNNKNGSKSTSSSSTTHITPDILSTFQPVKSFNYHKEGSITSLDFDDSGQYLISSGIDKSIQLYDIHKGIHYKDIQSQKYGAHLARFAHHDLNCLYASTPASSTDAEHAIRYLSLADNKYIRYFKGHKDQVTGLEVDPLHDLFMSSSVDRTVKLWDFRAATPVGNLNLGQRSVTAFDPQGIVFAVGLYPNPKENGSTGTIHFYDIKSFDKLPFLSTEIPISTPQTWTKLEFSNNGKLLLISTDCGEHYVVDAFLGQLLTTLGSSTSETNHCMKFKYPYTGSSCFTPCGKMIMVGTSSQSIQLYDLTNFKCTDGLAHIVREGDNPSHLPYFKALKSTQGIPKIVAFNPKLLVFASADNTVALWHAKND